MGTCGKYCKSLGLTCVSAYEEVSNTCTIESTFGCDTKVLGSDGKVTSDALCKCTADTGSTADAGAKTTTATGATTTMGGGAKTTTATGATTTMGGHSGKTHGGGGGIATPGSRMDPEAGAEVTSDEEGENEEQEHEQEQEEEDDDEEEDGEEEEDEEEGIASRIARLLEGLLANEGH